MASGCGNLTSKGRRRRAIVGVVNLLALAGVLALGTTIGAPWLVAALSALFAGMAVLSGLQAGAAT